MKKIARLEMRLRQSSERGIFHDSREDVKNLSIVINALIEKQNEVIAAVNELIEARNKEGGT